VTIDILPEEVLLEIFDLYVDPTRNYEGVEAWCTLVHVCRKWRNIVLESPLRMNLRIHCHPAKPVREKLDIWPALPVVLAQYYEEWQRKWGLDNVATALEQNNRICLIGLCGVPISQMEEILEAMHKPFPVLTGLSLESDGETASVDPEFFLGGSVPCLQFLELISIPFPRLPKLLLSAAHLAYLQLYDISHFEYISPESMASCFFALTRLETLILEFESPEYLPIGTHRPLPPPTRTLLPVPTRLQFAGVSEYLEDLVVRIDTPLLDNLIIHLFHRFIPDTPQLAQFINRSPKLKAHNKARVEFHDMDFRLKLGQESDKGLSIKCEVEDSHVQVCASFLSQASSATVERLYIYNYSYQRKILVESDHWLDLLRPFTSVKSLYLSLDIALALREVTAGEGVAGVLPALQTLFLGDLQLFGSDIWPFSGRLVAVSHLKTLWGD
jgi:F-box-like